MILHKFSGLISIFMLPFIKTKDRSKHHIMVVHTPDLILVMVAGKSKFVGLCVVIPTSIDPDHLSTNLSILIYK